MKFSALTVFLFAVIASCEPCLAATVRPAPKHSLLLRSSALTVTFDANDALPYKFAAHASQLWGEDTGRKMTAILCRLQPRGYVTVELTAKSGKVAGDKADFFFESSFEGSPAVSFHIVYTLEATTLVVTLDTVEERQGFELIEISAPNLVSIREEDGPGWLAHGRKGGALVSLQDARPTHLSDSEFFGRISTILPVQIAGNKQLECAMEVSAYMDGTETEVTGEAGHHHAHLGTVQVYRVHGGRSYAMNDGGPLIAGNEKTPNLLVGQQSRARLDFVGDFDGNGTVDWLDGAKLIRQRMPPIRSHYLDDKFLYLIYGKYKPEPKPRTSFKQSETLIHDVAMLTDYASQVAFVSGWVYDGQDTGFPCEDKVNESMSGLDGLQHLMAQGPKFNTNVTVNVNYDDAFHSCPALNDDLLARRPDGAIWRSRDWAGEDSYIMGLAKYMRSAGMERIEYMLKQYKIHGTILIDALSWFTIRNDWDPAHPASGYKNLIEGRFKIIDEFRKRGVDVISEMLRYPMVGELVESANGPAGGPDPFGGESIPMLPLIYRQSIIWGNEGGDPRHADQNLFWNARPIYWYGQETNRTDIADFYYLSVVPWMKVHSRDIESFRRVGYRSEIGLGKGSKIEIDWAAGDYSVVVDDIPVAGNNATFCPLDRDRIAFYSREGRTLKARLPAGWNGSDVAARILFTDRRERLVAKMEGPDIEVNVPANHPVIVYRNAALADRPYQPAQP